MEYLTTFLWALFRLTAEMAPYLLLGFLIAGILHVWVTPDKVAKHLGKPGISSVVKASIVGVPLPLCSCGVIPTGVSFHANGASKGAATSFLISTPQTGVDSILVTYSMLGLPFALIRPLMAFVTGVFGGWMVDTFDHTPVTPAQAACASSMTSANKISRVLHYAFVEFMQDLAKWLAIGLVMAALIEVAIPASFFESFEKGSWAEMGGILLASIPLYVCATASVPIAAVLVGKGVSAGAVLIFLMAGPATNAATISVLGKALGRKSLAIYLGSIIGGAMLFGYLVNIFYPNIFASLSLSHDHEHNMHWWEAVLAGVFLILLINALVQKMGWIPLKRKNTDPMQKIILVNGMSCNHCKSSVEKNLSSLEGIAAAEVDLASKEVAISGASVDMTKVKEKINQIGFEFVGEKE